MAGTPSPQEAAKVLSSLTTQQRQRLAQSGGLGGARSAGAGSNRRRKRVGSFTNPGSIVSSDSNSVTIQLSDGSTKIVLYAQLPPPSRCRRQDQRPT